MRQQRQERTVDESELGDYVPASIEQLRERQLRKRLIEQALDGARVEIDERAVLARNKNEPSFTLKFDGELGGAVFTDTRLNDILRAWVWSTYKGSLGFDKHAVLNGESHIRFRVR